MDPDYSNIANLEKELKRLDKADIPPKVKLKIKEFLQDKKLKGISEVRCYNLCVRLRKSAGIIPDRFLKPSVADTKKVITVVSETRLKPGTMFERNVSVATLESYKLALRSFYKWLIGNDKTIPECVAWIKIGGKDRHKKPENLVTPEEIKKIVDNAKNIRDKAIFQLLYDSGIRMGELLTLRIKDLEFDQYGAVVKVSGKTGYRHVRIVGDSIAYLRAWLDSHPLQNEPDSHLFVGMSDSKRSKPLSHSDIYSSLNKTTKRAGMRNINPHLFRHTRATILASRVTEAPLESQMGWVHGSQMTRVYVHMSRRDQDNAILKAYGIKVDDEGHLNEPIPKKCTRCGETNHSDARYCRKCWLPLTVEEALKMETIEKHIESTILSSNVVGDDMKALVKGFDDRFKDKILEGVLSQIMSSSELKQKFVQEISKSSGA